VAEQLTCVSILVCDDVYRDEQTKKLVIVGTFNQITTASFPCMHPKMSVLFTLTNGNGTYDVALAIEHEESATMIAELKGPLQVTDPLAINDVIVQFVGAVFPKAGKYWVVLKANGEIIGQRPFMVKLPEATK